MKKSLDLAVLHRGLFMKKLPFVEKLHNVNSKFQMLKNYILCKFS